MKRIALLIGFYLSLALTLTCILSSSPQFTRPIIAQTTVEIPFLREWETSAHADATAEAFSHWNNDEPPQIPEECARCHSTPGYRDFIGADGSPAGQVDRPAPIGTTIECIACHSQSTSDLERVVMPSGVEITGLGHEARCMQCHQGRASMFSIDDAIARAGVQNDDTVSPELEFIHIHYYAAVATKYGTIAKSGYEYKGKSYDAHFVHITEFDPCIKCHDAHTQQIKINECQSCHDEVSGKDDLKNIRMYGSLIDYDGDDNIEEGIYYEIEGLRHYLYQAIQAYARHISQKTIVYDETTYPYFFIDLNDNGVTDTNEAILPNAYNAWTARLLKAAYNYQLSSKDPGMFAHGGKYIIQLLYDSLEDLNTMLAKPIKMDNLRRIDDGHFAGSEEAFRHWDAEGRVPAECSKCHTAEGLPLFLAEGKTLSQEPSNGLQCATCHDDLKDFSRYEIDSVRFPSGTVVDSGDPETNVCMNCHQGRESTTSVNILIQGLDDDAVSNRLQFLNVHYFAAGATYFGTKAKGGYEYNGKTYLGVFTGCDIFQEQAEDEEDYAPGCLTCHTAHGLQVEPELCGDCHDEVLEENRLSAIRTSWLDYDADGDFEEGLADEIETMRKALYEAMQAYAIDNKNYPLVYDDTLYPYFFTDLNGNRLADPDEVVRENRYTSWTPRLLRAAYNYQYSSKDPGAFAHNGKYILQLLYDSLDSFDATSLQMVRP